MTRLASYATPNGNVVELHRNGRGMWIVQRGDQDGGSLVPVDTITAAEHYQYALECGQVDVAFPFGLPAVVL